MDIEAISYYFECQKKIVSGVLGRYVDAHGCPCAWPQFEYWASKQQGPGWNDSIQNELVENALKLPAFVRRKPEKPDFTLVALVECSECGREWSHHSYEWRMSAFHENLIPQTPTHAASRFSGLVDANFCATVGHEPRRYKTLNLAQWAEFMLGEPYDEAASAPKVLGEAPPKKSFLRHLVTTIFKLDRP